MHQDDFGGPDAHGEPGAPRAKKGFAALRALLAEVRQELKNIRFLDWPELRSTIITVVVFIVMLSAYICAVEYLCIRLLDPILLRRH